MKDKEVKGMSINDICVNPERKLDGGWRTLGPGRVYIYVHFIYMCVCIYMYICILTYVYMYIYLNICIYIMIEENHVWLCDENKKPIEKTKEKE
jgi:hypothetical protein